EKDYGPFSKVQKSIKDSDVKGEVKENGKVSSNDNAGDDEATWVASGTGSGPSTRRCKPNESREELARTILDVIERQY
ncbi:MAG: hypothetical protein Q9174_005973, partial [Haloplaca sp. 1 TL-2023]